MFRYSLVLFTALAFAVPSSAASWAEAMFEELSKDFGTVPRGPTLYHTFRLTNGTGQAVHISGVRVSCGCVSAAALQSQLAPGQSTAVQASMDTRRFSGVKAVTIYVQFDQPRWEEVRLWVQANGRDDITVTPEALALGQAKHGSTPAASVTVSLVGSSRWDIVEVQRESNYVRTSLKELRRDANEVSYQLTASIRADAPIGKWFTDVWLKTNDPSTARIRVPLTVEIESALSVSPSTLMLGEVKPGEQVQRKIVVRGTEPFRITKIEGTDDELSIQDSTSESKPVHVLTVTLKAAKAGEFERRLKVITDLKEDRETAFSAKARIAGDSE
jgi:hypothetical protein